MAGFAIFEEFADEGPAHIIEPALPPVVVHDASLRTFSCCDPAEVEDAGNLFAFTHDATADASVDVDMPSAASTVIGGRIVQLEASSDKWKHKCFRMKQKFVDVQKQVASLQERISASANLSGRKLGAHVPARTKMQVALTRNAKGYTNLEQVAIWCGDPNLSKGAISRWEVQAATSLVAEARNAHDEGESLLKMDPIEGNINIACHDWMQLDHSEKKR